MPAGDVLIARLLTSVAIDLGQSQAQLRQHKQQLEETQAAGQKMTQSQAEIGQKADELRAKLIQLNGELSGLRGVLRDMESQNANLGGALTPNIEKTRLEMARLQGQIVSTRGELRDLGKSADDSGEGFSKGASSIGKYFTALIAIEAGVGIVKDQAAAFGEFDQALVRTEALTNTTHQQIQEMIPTIRQLSVETGRPLKELGEALYFIESSGVRGADGLEILRVSAQGAAVGMGRTDEIAKLLTQTINTYGLSSKASAQLMDSLTVAVREGSGEASDYARNIGSVLPVAQALGINFNQVAGSLAVMSLGELNTARNATALRQVMQELISPGEQAQKALASIGLTAEQVRQMIAERGLPAALLEMRDRTQGNIDVLEKIFPDIRAFTGLLRLTGEQAGRYAEIVQQAGTETGTFGTAFATSGQAVELQSQRMAQAFGILGSTIAEQLAPHITPLVEAITSNLTPAVETSGQKAATAATGWERLGAAIQFVAEHIPQGPPTAPVPEAGQNPLGGTVGFERYAREADLIRAEQHRAQELQEQAAKGTPLSQQAGDTWRMEAHEAANAIREGTQEITQTIEERGNRVQDAYEAAMSFDRQQVLMGETGQKLIKAIDDFVAKPFDQGGQQALESAAQLQQKIQEAWRTGLDPATAEAQITRLTNAITTLINAEGEEAKAAARNAVQGILVEFGQAAESQKVQQRVQQQQRSAEAETKRQQADAERQAREAQERLVSGLISDLEGQRHGLQEAYGRAADSAISTFVSALSGARSGKTTEPIMQAQARLAEQLKTAGVENWQQAAERVGQAYLAALAGTISGSQAAQVLAGAIAEIPRLSPETFARGIDRQAFLSLGGNAGRSLAEGIEAGFREGGQKSISEVQKSAIAMLRETEKITDPDLAYQRSVEFWDALQQAIREGTPEAIAALEEFSAQWNRQLQLDIAQQQYLDKVREANVERTQKIVEANAEATRQIDEVVRGVGEERGAQGLESFRNHMRSALGEESALFRQVNEQIDAQQAALGGAEGFRQARENFQRLMDDRLDRFREEQYQEQTTFQEGEEAKRRELQHTREEEDANRRHAREDQQLTLQQSRENQDITRRRGREDAEAQRQLAKEIADAQKRGASPAEIAGIQTRFGESQADRDRARRFEEEDRNIARGRAQEDLQTRRGQETADRQFARQRENEDVQNQRDARTRQHDFEIGQAHKLRDEQRAIALEVRNFEDQQSDAHLGKQLRNIDAERVKRLAEADKTFDELEAKEAAHRDNVEEQVNRPAWRRMLQSFTDEFADPAQSLVDRLITSALGPDRGGSAVVPEQAASISAAAQARQSVQALTALSAQQQGPIDVRLPDEQVQDFADAASDRPVQMDGEDVEDVQSKIRRDRYRHRGLG